MTSFYAIAEKALALEATGRHVVRLNVGDTNLPCPPCAVEAAVRSLRDERDGYGPALGLPALRERIAAREGCSPEQVVVGPGSKHLLFGILSVLRGKVWFPSPSWPAFHLICNHLGLDAQSPSTTLESGWRLPLQDLADSRPDIAIVCNPVNPTSTVFGAAEVEEAIEIVGSGGGHVILDEAYRGLAFDPMPSHDAIRLRSFSKEFNLEGWRIGYAVVPPSIALKLQSFLHLTTTCVPAFVQRAAMACLREELMILERNRSTWVERAEVATAALLRHGFQFAVPGAGMYVFVTHARITDGDRYALELVDRGVVVAPGSTFGAHGNFVRVCLNQEPRVLEGAIAAMAEGL